MMIRINPPAGNVGHYQDTAAGAARPWQMSCLFKDSQVALQIASHSSVIITIAGADARPNQTSLRTDMNRPAITRRPLAFLGSKQFISVRVVDQSQLRLAIFDIANRDC